MQTSKSSKTRNPIHRWAMVWLLTFVLPMTQSWGAMISTDKVVSDIAVERARIQALVEREDVQTKLVELGVSPQEASERVASLSDTEVANVAGHLDSLPAGGDGIYIGLGTLLIILIVVLLLR